MNQLIIKEEWSHLKEIVLEVLKQAKDLGMTAAEAGVVYNSGLSVNVRMNEPETIEFNRDKSLGITVYKGKKKGSVSTTDIQPAAIRSSLEAACRIANYTEEDPCSGLADIDKMANLNKVDDTINKLDLYHPFDIKTEQAIEAAKECEAAARAFDKRIVNSDGASFTTHEIYRVYGNSHGFLGAYPSTRYALACTVIAKDKDSMQRDHDFTIARSFKDLIVRNKVGEAAAIRTLRRLHGRKIKTGTAPVIFAAEIAGGLIGHFIAAISGGNLYRKSSFLVDHLGKKVFPNFIDIIEDPFLPKGLGSAPFDQEGVATERHPIVEAGVLQSYVLGSYSARKLGLKTTGNSGGVHNLIIADNQNKNNYQGKYNLPELLKNMNKGLLVTELLGQGINLVTGDYSRGAAGFWVENGEIQYPVEEITIAGNLKEMFDRLVAVGNDIETRSSVLTGSIWIDRMTIAGS